MLIDLDVERALRESKAKGDTEAFLEAMKARMQDMLEKIEQMLAQVRNQEGP